MTTLVNYIIIFGPRTIKKSQYIRPLRFISLIRSEKIQNLMKEGGKKHLGKNIEPFFGRPIKKTLDKFLEKLLRGTKKQLLTYLKKKVMRATKKT